MNNGPTKGAAPEAWQIVRDSPGFEDLWQGHLAVIDKASGAKGSFGKSEGTAPRNAPQEFIANLDENESTCAAHWIKVAAHEDGTFTVTNGRTGSTKTYASRASSAGG